MIGNQTPANQSLKLTELASPAATFGSKNTTGLHVTHGD